MSSSLVRAFANQRRSVLLALALCVASVWIAIPLGNWQVGVFLAVGILLSLVNNVLNEHTLLTSVESGELPTRQQFAMSAFVRLMLVSVAAAAIAAGFWPNGLSVFFGLAIFHVIAVVFTDLPLLREMRKV